MDEKGGPRMKRFLVIMNGSIVWESNYKTLAEKKCDLLAKKCVEGEDELYLRDTQTGRDRYWL